MVWGFLLLFFLHVWIGCVVWFWYDWCSNKLHLYVWIGYWVSVTLLCTAGITCVQAGLMQAAAVTHLCHSCSCKMVLYRCQGCLWCDTFANMLQKKLQLVLPFHIWYPDFKQQLMWNRVRSESEIIYELEPLKHSLISIGVSCAATHCPASGKGGCNPADHSCVHLLPTHHTER